MVGFQTRNPLHRFLFEMTTRVMWGGPGQSAAHAGGWHDPAR
ncbi:MAG: hypothetical protein R2874_07620 [Desulfobacterales bacterium]